MNEAQATGRADGLRAPDMDLRERVAGPFAWVLGLVLLAAGVGLTGTTVNVSIFHAINGTAAQWGELGSWGSVLGLGAVPVILAGCLGPRRAGALAAVLVALLAGGALVQILKYLLHEPRPVVVLGRMAMQVVGSELHGRSMPSGHSAAAGCAAAMLALAAKRGLLSRPLALAAAVLAVLLVLSRVVVGAHWPSDVLAGAGLGVLSGTLVVGTQRGWALCRRVAAALRRRVGSVAAALVIGLAGASVWRSRQDYPLASWVNVVLVAACAAAVLVWLLAAVRQPRVEVAGQAVP